MPLKLYDSQDAVPDALRATAIETKDGKFAVVEEDASLGEKGERALEAAKTKAREEERARKAAEKQLEELKLKAEAAEKGISEAALEEIRQKANADKKPLEDELATVKAENRKLKLTDRVQALYLANGGMSDRVEDAMLVLDRRTELGDAGGIVFKDKDGKATADTAETFFPKLKIEKPWLFKGSGSRGSGARGSDATEDDVPRSKQDTIDAKRREVAGAF